MRIFSLLVSTSLLLSQSVLATQIYEKSLANGMDDAIIQAFVESTQDALYDTKSIPLEEIKNSIENLKINDDKLLVSFDDDKLAQILDKRGIVTFQGLENPVLVWFANVSENSINIINSDGVDEFSQAFSQACAKLHYNLMFPLMDLDDAQFVDDKTILTHSDLNLAKASTRYGSDYFIAGAIEQDSQTLAYSVKWNVFDKQGNNLGQGQNQGELATLADSLAMEIAKVLAASQMSTDSQNQEQNATANSTQEATASDSVALEDILGPVEGGVQVLFSGIDNVADYPNIKKALISYGYEADISVVGYNENGVIFLIPTNSSPEILDGTLSHASEFTKIAPWTYNYNKSYGSVKADENFGRVTKSKESRVTSNIKNYNDEAYSKHTVKKTIETTTTTTIVNSDGAEVINLTDDSDASSNGLDLDGINITH